MSAFAILIPSTPWFGFGPQGESRSDLTAVHGPMKLSTIALTISLAFCGLSQGALTIQSIDFSQYPEHEGLGDAEWSSSGNSGGGFMLVHWSSTMHFSDGSSLGLAAGVMIGMAGKPVSAGASGSTVTYLFDKIPVNEPVSSKLFYYAQKFTSEAYFIELNYDGPISFTAEIGGATALWSGWAEVVSYHSIYNSSWESSAAGAAPVGSLVPFEMRYDITDGSVWTEDRFSRDFKYKSSGAVNLASWIVPEPSAGIFAGMAGIAFAGWRRGRRY